MFKMTDNEILAMDCVPVAVAAEYIGMYQQSVRVALQQCRAPFGFAYKGEGGRWAYNISPGGLVKYKREGITLAAKEGQV